MCMIFNNSLHLKTLFRRFDWLLGGITLLLVGIGFLGLVSAELPQGDAFPNLTKQILIMASMVPLMILLATWNYRQLSLLLPWIWVGTIMILLGVLVVGATIRGSQGWFVLGSLHVQPVEIAKIVLLLVLARFFSLQGSALTWRNLVVSGLITASFVVPVLLQPDTGSAALLIALWLCFLLLCASRKQLLSIALVGAVVIAVGGAFFLKPYQRARIMTFFSPQNDRLGSSYNLNQAILAIGSGGLWGQGMGKGPITSLRFLPEQETDFMVAVLGESFGFVGISVLLTAVMALLFVLVRRARHIHERYGSLLYLGFGSLIMVESFLNIGMNIGLTPIVGIGLPFVSYGGSSLMAHMLGIGILESVGVHQRGTGVDSLSTI